LNLEKFFIDFNLPQEGRRKEAEMPKVVYELKNGRFMLLPGNYINPEAADSELDGFYSLVDWYLQKITTKHFVLLFPYLGLWPTVDRMSSLSVDYFKVTEIPSEILNDTKVVFWPKEISNCSLRRAKDVVIGKEKTTTVSYLQEVKDYILNSYSGPHLDYCFYILAADIHFERVKRDFILVMKQIKSHRILFVPFIVKTTGSNRSKFAHREKLILLLSSLYPSLYMWSSLKKGGLK